MDDAGWFTEHAAACAEMMSAMDAASAMPMMGAGTMGAGGMMGMGWLMLAFWLLVALVLILVVAVLVRRLRRGEGASGGETSRLEEELGLRYVRGEIDRETYVRIREHLAERS